MSETSNLNQVMLDADSEMKRLGYSQESMCHYWEVWKRYLKFSDHASVSREDMDSFLKQTYGVIVNNNDTTRYQRGAIRAMNVLDYYSKTGKIYIRFPLSNPTSTNTALDPVLTLFQTYLQESGYADSTIHLHERVIRISLLPPSMHSTLQRYQRSGQNIYRHLSLKLPAIKVRFLMSLIP